MMINASVKKPELKFTTDGYDVDTFYLIGHHPPEMLLKAIADEHDDYEHLRVEDVLHGYQYHVPTHGGEWDRIIYDCAEGETKNTYAVTKVNVA